MTFRGFNYSNNHIDSYTELLDTGTYFVDAKFEPYIGRATGYRDIKLKIINIIESKAEPQYIQYIEIDDEIFEEIAKRLKEHLSEMVKEVFESDERR